ncbi:unnamed protein product [Darwinula stevensoni]|uniref:Uncharacterized protein n=1 Tax=Darwinula stevensoni TaxID=69355 RepID=A0A7R9AIT3_9CRUS|nr:unnamed protein product [Darwinula stevensoni]CAG0906392.1 unnamed protein product [Darwinula stevensoni]
MGAHRPYGGVQECGGGDGDGEFLLGRGSGGFLSGRQGILRDGEVGLHGGELPDRDAGGFVLQHHRRVRDAGDGERGRDGPDPDHQRRGADPGHLRRVHGRQAHP